MRFHKAAVLSILSILLVTPVFADNAIISDTDGAVVMQSQLESIIRQAPAEYRKELLESDDSIRSLLGSLLKRAKLLKEAEKKALREKPDVAARIEREIDDILIMELKRDYVASLPEKDATKMALEYYTAHPEEFLVKERRKASHILFRVGTPADKEKRKAEMVQLRERIINGEDFAALAKEFSEDSSAAKGGSLGWIDRGKTVKPFEEALFALDKPGALSDVVETQFGYHLVLLNEVEPEHQQSFAEVKSKLIEKETQKYKLARLNEYLQGIMQMTSPEINGDLLDAVRAKFANK